MFGENMKWEDARDLWIKLSAEKREDYSKAVADTVSNIEESNPESTKFFGANPLPPERRAELMRQSDEMSSPSRLLKDGVDRQLSDITTWMATLTPVELGFVSGYADGKSIHQTSELGDLMGIGMDMIVGAMKK